MFGMRGRVCYAPSDANAGGVTEQPGLASEDGDAYMVDMAGVDENGNFPVLPVGTYDVEVDQLEFRTSKSGNPDWQWRFEVTNGEYKGQKLFYHTTFTEGGMPRVKKTLARIKTTSGYEQQLLAAKFSPKKVADEGQLIGARCRVKVAIRKYNNKDTNDVKDVLPPADAASQGGNFSV